jgi:predicted small lipoprotein YifL
MKEVTMRRWKTGTVLAATLLSLAACSRSEPEQAPSAENFAAEDAPLAEPTTSADVPVAEPSAAEARAEAANSAMIDVPPEAPIAPDAQVLDDADATGMTARVSRDEAVANDQAEQ